MRTEDILISVITIETTIIGFFIHFHWWENRRMKRDVDELKMDKQLRKNKTSSQ